MIEARTQRPNITSLCEISRTNMAMRQKADNQGYKDGEVE